MNEPSLGLILAITFPAIFIFAWVFAKIAQKTGYPCPLCKGSFSCHTMDCPLILTYSGYELTEEELEKLRDCGYPQSYDDFY